MQKKKEKMICLFHFLGFLDKIFRLNLKVEKQVKKTLYLAPIWMYGGFNLCFQEVIALEPLLHLR